MESFFPELFFLSFIAQIILRLAVAGVFFYDAQNIWRALPSRRIFAAASALIGTLIAIGLFTQIAVIAAAIQAVMATLRYQKESVFGNKIVLILSLAILLFLLIAGPGGIALDLPY